jgi:transposase
MKSQLSKLSRTKARYTEEYKQEALELWRKSGRSAAKVAAELGIRAPLLYRWARPKHQADHSKAELNAGQSVEELEAEIRRLRELVCSRVRVGCIWSWCSICSRVALWVGP